LKQRRLCQRGEAWIWSGCNPDFAPGVFHGEKRFAKTAQHFEMAQQKSGQRFAVFARSTISLLALLVTTGLDPVVHADVRLSRPFKEVLQAWLPHGLPGQARQ